VLRVPSSTTAFAYDRDGKTTTVTFNGQVYAASSFDAKQGLARVAYLGGSSLGVAWEDKRGMAGSQRRLLLEASAIPKVCVVTNFFS
jgi:hypothetical protein